MLKTRLRMPIPPYTPEGVLPPHVGNPASSRQDLSPYHVTIVDVCQRWRSSPERRDILNGLLQLRGALRANGIIDGFQWLDGSFVEHSESTRGLPPNDIDVVTFFVPPPAILPGGAATLSIIQNRGATKTNYRVDHILVSLGQYPALLVDETRYWTGLFSHRKSDDLWKGMLRIELGDIAGDITSQALLAKP